MSDAATQRRAQLHFGLRVNERVDAYSHIALKMACKVGDRIFAADGGAALHGDQFPINPGEAIRAEIGTFARALPGDPQWCDLTVFEGELSQEKAVATASRCWKPDGTVTQGLCEARPEMASDAAAGGSVKVEPGESWTSGTFHLFRNGPVRPVDYSEVLVAAFQRGGALDAIEVMCIRGDKLTKGECGPTSTKGADAVVGTLYTFR